MEYCIRATSEEPRLDAPWDETPWTRADTLSIGHFHPQSSSHRPRTQARLLHDEKALYVHFRVEDQYVRSTVTECQGPVCGDSCAEFFVRPRAEQGYFNFEINAGGTLHVSYVEDPTRLPGNQGFAKYQFVHSTWTDQVPIHHSLPAVVEPERSEPTTWFLAYRIPRGLFEAYVGPLGPLSGQTWAANFYKCGDHTSQPHWASWAPLGAKLNFHLPQYFAPIHLD